MSRIALEVTKTDPARPSRRTYALPVSVGRGSDCDIQLPASNRAISRVHVEFVAENGGVVIYNRASNLEATRFNGRTLRPNERVEVTPGDRVTIFGTEILILEPAALGIMIARRDDLSPVGGHYLLPGTALLLRSTGGDPAVEHLDDFTALDADDIGNGLALLFYYDGSRPSFAVVANPDAAPVLLDRGILDQAALYIRAEDTIEVASHRYEVLTVGEDSIVCENPGCQVLNGSGRGANCRNCGTPLPGAPYPGRIRHL